MWCEILVRHESELTTCMSNDIIKKFLSLFTYQSNVEFVISGHFNSYYLYLDINKSKFFIVIYK